MFREFRKKTEQELWDYLRDVRQKIENGKCRFNNGGKRRVVEDATLIIFMNIVSMLMVAEDHSLMEYV